MTKVSLYYDGECPFCNRYSKLTQLRECINLELLDARIDQGWKRYDANIELDNGIILVVHDTSMVLQGVDAVAYLDNVCAFRGIFFGLQKFIFSHKMLAGIVYSFLKLLRKAALYLKA